MFKHWAFISIFFFFLIPGSLRCETAPAFSLQDQHGYVKTVRFPSEKKTVLIIADRSSFKQTTGWATAFIQKGVSQNAYYAIAVLGDGPWFYKWVTRGFFTHKPSILLDWGGRISRKFQYQKGICKLLLMDKDGTLICSESGPFSQKKWARFKGY